MNKKIIGILTVAVIVFGTLLFLNLRYQPSEITEKFSSEGSEAVAKNGKYGEIYNSYVQ